MIVDSETSRIRAASVNSGRYSFAEADAKLLATKLAIHVTEAAACSPAGQAALLTCVATGSRCFGEVTVSGALDHPLCVPLPVDATTLAQAATILGGAVQAADSAARMIFIGESTRATSRPWAVNTYWDRWKAGVTPAARPMPLGSGTIALSGIAAGALAVGEAFLAEQGDLRAGRSAQLVSLWSHQSNPDDARGPETYALPLELWLVGVGNLGQAFLWSLFFLPYAEPERVELFLQDDDRVRPENWGTSILVQRGRYKALKTRVAEEWADRRGFRVRRIDRRLDEHLRRADGEPAIALAGLDRMPPRRLLDRPGFQHIIDVGLGASAADYRKFRINAFSAAQTASRHFDGVEDDTRERIAQTIQLPAYQELLNVYRLDDCGTAQLAGIAVAVPFVSAFAGAMAVTQVIRIASGQAPYLGLTGWVGDLSTIRGALGRSPERLAFATAQTSRR